MNLRPSLLTVISTIMLPVARLCFLCLFRSCTKRFLLHSVLSSSFYHVHCPCTFNNSDFLSFSLSLFLGNKIPFASFGFDAKSRGWEIFKTRCKIISYIRRFLDDLDFLEVCSHFGYFIASCLWLLLLEKG